MSSVINAATCDLQVPLNQLGPALDAFSATTRGQWHDLRLVEEALSQSEINPAELSAAQRELLRDWTPSRIEALRTTVRAAFAQAHRADWIKHSGQTVDSSPSYRQANCLTNKIDDLVTALLARVNR